MIIVILMLLPWAHAAPHRDFPVMVSAAIVKQLLTKQLPTNSEQVSQIKNLGPEAYKQLREIMLSSNEPMDVRWNATLAVARIGGEESQPDIDLALENPVWYMRSAGLLACSIISKDRGVEKAKKFLRHDPALLVRAAALQVIAQEQEVDREFLWSELYNPRNFHRGESLSLRLSLLKVLSRKTKKDESSKFVALMRDKQPEIKNLAKQVLEKHFFISKNSAVE